MTVLVSRGSSIVWLRLLFRFQRLVKLQEGFTLNTSSVCHGSSRNDPVITRALALKAPTLLRKINAMILRNRPVSVSYIGQPQGFNGFCNRVCGFFEAFSGINPEVDQTVGEEYPSWLCNSPAELACF